MSSKRKHEDDEEEFEGDETESDDEYKPNKEIDTTVVKTYPKRPRTVLLDFNELLNISNKRSKKLKKDYKPKKVEEETKEKENIEEDIEEDEEEEEENDEDDGIYEYNYNLVTTIPYDNVYNKAIKNYLSFLPNIPNNIIGLYLDIEVRLKLTSEWAIALNTSFKNTHRKEIKTNKKLLHNFRETILEIDANDVTIKKILNSGKSKQDIIDMLFQYSIYDNEMISDERWSDLRSLTTKLLESNKIAQQKQKLICKTDNLKQILELKAPDKYKMILYEKYEYYESLSDRSDEKFPIRKWIKLALSMPLEIKILNGNLPFLKNVKDILDKNLYGMKKQKEEILLIINNILLNPSATYKSLGFCGKPGTGKTSLARCMAKACGLDFEQISLGGIYDPHFITGHSSTYINSNAGSVAKAFSRMKHSNGIMYFDEIDKISNSRVFNAMLSVIDTTQNSEYFDEYLDTLPIDLSKVWFMFALNDKAQLNPILADRMYIIDVDDYTNKEKCEILKNYSLPKFLDNFKLSNEDVIFEPSTYEFMTTRRHNESGMRSLNSDLLAILKRISLIKTLYVDNKITNEFDFKFLEGIKNIKFPGFVITQDVALKFLGDNTAHDDSYKHLYM